jgi:hypothetical protein
MGYGAIPWLYNAVGRRLVGFPISCHCFRHSVVTATLTKNPRNIKIASGTLTHRSLRIVNKHYDLSGEAVVAKSGTSGVGTSSGGKGCVSHDRPSGDLRQIFFRHAARCIHR